MPPVVPFAVAPTGLRLAVRLTPRASAPRIMGLVSEADGRVALKVAVTAAAEDGKANEALLVLVAELLDLPRGGVTLVQGAGGRRKLVHVAGDPDALARRLAEVLRPWLTPGS